MEYTDKEKFEELWKDFLIQLRGKLITAGQKQQLSLAYANLILSDVCGTWDDEYSINGRWLLQLAQNDAPKAELVRDVLLHDITFTEVEKSFTLPGYCNYLIPGLGACAGYAASYYWEYGKWVQAASVLVPAALLFPSVKMVGRSLVERSIAKSIENYISQLDKFEKSILTILSE